MTVPEASPTPWTERLLVAVYSVVLGFGTVAWVLALAGFFLLGPVLILGLAATVSVYTVWSPGSGGGPAPGGGGVVTLVVAALAVVSGVAFGGAHVLADGTAAAHSITAEHLAAAGDLVVPVSTEAFAGYGAPGEGGFAIRPGGVTPDAPRLVTALAGIWAWAQNGFVTGIGGVLVAAIVLAMFVLGRSLGLRSGTAAAAAVAFAVGPLAVLGGRDTSEVVLAGFLIVSGLWALGVARTSSRPGRAVIAGALLGAGAAASPDMWIYAADGAGYLGLRTIGSSGVAYLGRRARLRPAAFAAAGAAPYVVFAWWDAATRDGVAGWTERGWPAVPAVAAVLVLTVVVSRPGRKIPASWRRAGGWLALVAGTGVVLYGLAVRAAGDVEASALRWLWWYAGPVAMAAGIAVVLVMIRRSFAEEAGAWGPVLAVGGVAGAALAVDPGTSGPHHAAALALLPAVLPVLLLGTGWLVDRLFDDPERPILQVMALLLAGGMIAGAAWYSIPVWDAPVQARAAAGIDAVCDRLPEDAAAAIVGPPSGSGSAAPAVAARCGVPAADLGGFDPEVLAAAWASRGRELYVVVVGGTPVPGTVPVAEAGSLLLTRLAQHADGPPHEVEERGWPITIAVPG